MDKQETRLEKTWYFWWKEGAVPVTFFINSILKVISR